MVSKLRMSLDEFLDLSKGKPNVFFNSYQRGYAALSSMGKTEGVWNFVYKQANDKRKISDLYGLDDVADTFMTILKSGTQSPEERSKMTLLIGPAASGKSQFEKTVAETLKVYGEREKDLYVARVHLDEQSLSTAVKDLLVQNGADFDNFLNRIGKTFNDLRDIKLAPGLEIQTALSLFFGTEQPENQKKLEDAIDSANKTLTEAWQKVSIDSGRVSSSASWTRDKLSGILGEFLKTEEGEPDQAKISEALARLVSIERATENDVEVALKPPVALGEKNLDYKAVFGGKLDYGLIGLIKNNTNPMVLGYGVVGGQNLPSPRGNVVVFSEVLKSPESFKSSSLDLVQDREVKFGSYKESLDSILLGTTNLDEYSQIGANLKDYFMSRTNPILFKAMTRLSSAEKALKSMFEESSQKLKFHYSPRFLSALAYIWVMSALDEETNLTLKQKADLYNGKKLPEVKLTAEELMKKANSKSLLEITEGVKRGVPYREMRQSIVKFLLYARNIQSKLYGKRAEEEELCLDSAFGGDNSTEYLETFLNTMEGISEETKARLHGEKGKALIEMAFGVYRRGIEEDVANCYAADNAVTELTSKYVLHKYFQKLGNKKFPYNGKYENVDEAFLSNIEKKGYLNGDVIGSTITTRVREKYNGEINDNVLKEMSQAIIENNPNIVKGLIELLRPQPGVVLSADKDAIKRKLRERYHYCDRKGGCSDVAYGLFDSHK